MRIHDSFATSNRKQQFVIAIQWRSSLVAAGLLLTGCGRDAPPPTTANPYANNSPAPTATPSTVPVQSTPATPPAAAGGPPTTTMRATPTVPGTSSTGGRAPTQDTSTAPSPTTVDAVTLPEAGIGAETGVPLTFVEYAKMARRSAEMLAELTEIHATVSESGDATDYQERWGELTAAHSKLIREVVQAPYPPGDLARELKPNALSRLHGEIQVAATVMENYVDVEGGLAQPYAEAKRIFDHLTKNLTSADLKSMSED